MLAQPGVYVITNIVNGKQYIGSSTNMKARWSKHKRELNGGYHHCHHLQNAWVKYGPDAFRCDVVECTDKTQLIVREQYWMDAVNPEYNASRLAGTPGGYTLTKEERERLSSSLTKVYNTEAGRKLQSERAKAGWSSEHREKRVIANQWKRTEEHSRKQSEENRRRWSNPEYRARLVEAFKKAAAARRQNGSNH